MNSINNDTINNTPNNVFQIPQKCQKCAGTLTQDQLYMSFYSCKDCGFNGKLNDGTVDWSVSANRKPLIILATLFLLSAAFTTAYFGWDKYQRTHSYNFSNMDLNEAHTQKEKCLQLNNHKCLKNAYLHLSQLQPDATEWKANAAIRMTELGEHQSAIEIYQDLNSKGIGTFDLLYYYGKSLRALGKLEEASNVFSQSYAIYPRMLDVIEALSETLVELQRPDEALSLLQEFAERSTDAKSAVEGRITVISDLVQKNRQTKKLEAIKLLSRSGGHHYVRLQIGRMSAPSIVDTGASIVTLPSTIAQEALTKDELRSARSARFKVANGQIINAKVTRVKTMNINGVEVRGVEVAFCETCQSLAGQSLLSKFDIRIEKQNGLESMTLMKR